MTNPRELQGLCHVPYGLEHPYEGEPFERFPRDPIAGQPVALGVTTSPQGAATAVWAEWRLDGTEEGQVSQGRWIKDEEERSCWRVQLPAFERGQRVTYRLHARQRDRLFSSQTFSFFAAGWLQAKDVTTFRFTPDGVVLTCTCSDSVLKPNVAITWLSPGLLRLRLTTRAAHGTRPPAPEAGNPCPDGASYRVIEETTERIALANEGVRVTVQRHPFRVDVRAADGTVLLHEEQPVKWLADEDGRALRVRQTFVGQHQQAFCGFGERFNTLDQRGQRLDVRVFEQYKNQGRRTYLPMPFFVSSTGFGHYVSTCRNVAYDLAASRPDRWSFDAELGPEGNLDTFLIIGDPKQVIASFAGLTGKPVLPPLWVFGPWMSGNEWNSQATVMEQARKTMEHRIPATVLVIEAWSDESTFYIWNDAQYTPKAADQAFSYSDFFFPPGGRWPDPKGMIEELHRQGIRVILWQIPAMKKLDEPHRQHDRDTAFMVEQGYCVREADGRPYRIRPFWFHDGLVLDFTNPKATRWWLDKRAYLLDELGIDGFKTDGGEHLWGRDLRFADGRKGDELWNAYPNLYMGAYFGFAQEKRGGDAVTFSRAGFTGAQAFPCHWAGDENSTWEAFRASVIAGLSAGVSGVPFWGWDLAGFSGEIPSADLYLQSAAMAAFCPIMQYHSEFNEQRRPLRDRTPWNIAERTGDPRVVPVFRFYANLRMNLLPYVFGQAQHSSQTGLPLMRAMWIEYPHDPVCWTLEDQYLFGDALVVAPVLEAGARHREVYLPGGRWYDFWNQKLHEGARWITCDLLQDRIPVFVREGSVLPLCTGPGYGLGSPITGDAMQDARRVFRVYPATVHTTDSWYDEPTARTISFTLEPQPNGDMRVDVPALPYVCTLLVPDVGFRKVECDGRPLSRVESLEGLTADCWFVEAKRWVYVELTAATEPRQFVLSLRSE